MLSIFLALWLMHIWGWKIYPPVHDASTFIALMGFLTVGLVGITAMLLELQLYVRLLSLQ
jgi:hypothetical protein